MSQSNCLINLVTAYIVAKAAVAVAVVLGAGLVAGKIISGISKETTECKSGQKQN